MRNQTTLPSKPLMLTRKSFFYSYFVGRIKQGLVGSVIFSHFTSRPSWHWCVDHFWSTWRCTNISVSIWICPQSCLSANFSSSEKPVVITALGVGIDTNDTKFFAFFYGEFSLGIFKSLASSKSSSLFLLLRLFFRNTLFVCSTCHNNSYIIN